MQQPAGEVTSVEVPPSVVETVHAETTAAHGEAEVHHEALLGLDSYGWVGLAFLAFVFFMWRLGAFKGIGVALDARGARIRAELDEAKALRAEAEALLAEHKRQQAAAEKDAEAIIAHARQEAGQIVAAAQKSAEAMVARRAAMAEAKIGAAERAAETELRARAANLATAAAAQIIAGSTDKATKTKLTDAAISELDRRLH
ncbi:MAG: F0F1 ATP synthase subunit B [Sphingomonadaceae bacterium]|nr:F0F1 ATP synthase subunit B [Sphingomonadaceae bacterium]